MVHYARKHWRGQLSLELSFWGNLFAPHVFLWLLAEWWLRDWDGESIALALRPDIAALLFSVLVGAVISVLIWQVVGVIRSAQCHKQRTGRKGAALASQGVAILVLALFLPVFWVIPYRYLFGMAMVAIGMAPHQFERAQVSVCPAYAAIKVEGDFALGLTREVRRLLDRNPGIETIVLDSRGGHAYEASALHRIILEQALNTISLETCSSACAIAFTAGAHRSIGENARLAFHAIGPVAWDSSGLDLDLQQGIVNRLLLSRGISEAFVEKASAVPPESIWAPSHDILLEAGVIDGFVDSSTHSRLALGACFETQY